MVTTRKTKSAAQRTTKPVAQRKSTRKRHRQAMFAPDAVEFADINTGTLRPTGPYDPADFNPLHAGSVSLYSNPKAPVAAADAVIPAPAAAADTASASAQRAVRMHMQRVIREMR